MRIAVSRYTIASFPAWTITGSSNYYKKHPGKSNDISTGALNSAFGMHTKVISHCCCQYHNSILFNYCMYTLIAFASVSAATRTASPLASHPLWPVPSSLIMNRSSLLSYRHWLPDFSDSNLSVINCMLLSKLPHVYCDLFNFRIVRIFNYFSFSSW